MSALTPRAYLVSLGLAKEGRGKFSKEAHAALDAAKAKGMVFVEPAKPVAKPRQPKAAAAPKQDKPKVSLVKATPLTVFKDRPTLRKQETKYALTAEGFRVGYDTCFNLNCGQPISRCDCHEGPKPPAGATPVESYPII